MKQFAWWMVQIAIIAGCMYAFSDIATEKGTEFHVGQALTIGIILAFLVTITLNVIVGQWQHWSSFIERKSVRRK